MAGTAVSEPIDFGGDPPRNVAIEGAWSRVDGCLEFRGPGQGIVTVENSAARIFVRFSAPSGRAIVGVREDGPPLDRDYCGDDCHEDPDRGAATVVTADREYAIVRRDDVERHELTFEVDAPGVRLHSIRFE